jgi:uncharacterized membrane protein YgdD (TMEM256/DUF423 family)
MAVGPSVATANSVLDALGNATSFSYSAYWIQLHTAEPGAAGTTAVAGNATRKQVSFGTAASGLMSNDVAISWTSGEVDTSEDYTHWSAWTLVSAGVFIQSGSMTANAVTTGDTFTIPIGDLDLTISVAS